MKPENLPKEYEKFYKNKARCTRCNDVIESIHRHDYQQCKCATIMVDGGHDYWRYGFMVQDDFERIWEPLEKPYEPKTLTTDQFAEVLYKYMLWKEHESKKDS